MSIFSLQPSNQTTIGLSAVRPQIQMSTTPQMRVIAHPGTAIGTPARPAQPIQHRIVTVSNVSSILFYGFILIYKEIIVNYLSHKFIKIL